MLDDANKSLRRLYPDYEEQAEPCRDVIRKIMAELKTDNALNALTEALQRVVNKYGEGQKCQVYSLWLSAAAVDVINERK